MKQKLTRKKKLFFIFKAWLSQKKEQQPCIPSVLARMRMSPLVGRPLKVFTFCSFLFLLFWLLFFSICNYLIFITPH